MEKFALVSVYDKSGLEEFARGLVELGYKILSTGGTATFLQQQGVPTVSIGDYTGQPEILGGRVKSLHPKIHGGILARRDNPQDMRELAEHQISLIDFVVVNLYPFALKTEEVLAQGKAQHQSLIEFIDIGGPTMIRAAAKNCSFVAPVISPADYPQILAELKSCGEISLALRRTLARKVFGTISAYDALIARYFALDEQLLHGENEPKLLAPVETISLERVLPLRYGENPHQEAALYRRVCDAGQGANLRREMWRQEQGKELSYNNLLDMYATLDLFLELKSAAGAEQVAVIVKHSNPCGVAQKPSTHQAFVAARDCDPISAFGGIVAISGEVDARVAEAINEGFVEVLLTQSVDESARQILAKKKNMRVLICDFAAYLSQRKRNGVSVRNYFDEFLLQTFDAALFVPAEEALVAGPKPSENELKDLQFAWRVCKHVKSNAIVIVKDQCALGVGAGQMSRVDAAKLAIQRASAQGFSLTGAMAASDAFLPFPDTLEVLAAAGVRGLVQPGGSIKDEDVKATAEQLEVSMFFTGERHFRH